MRGDSIRDLYAKALALLGLGVLAGTGALVDYWPIGISVPNVSSALDRPGLPGPAAAPDVAARGVVVSSTPRAAQPVEAPTVSRPGPAASAASFVPLMLWAPAATLGHPVSLREPVETAANLDAAVQTTDAPPDTSFVQADELVQADPSEFLPIDPRVTSVARADTSDDDPGFITGAFRKTGSSIVKTGAKTGASIFDAVRVVGGAVRRALPN